MTTTGNNTAEMAMARANVYGLLAGIFRQEPSESLLSKFQEPEFSGALKSLNISLDEVFDNTSGEQLVEDLAVEFTRLFIGPNSHISPHESMHVEPRPGERQALWGAQTVAVKKFMQATEVEVDDAFYGMPDHISAELEFMQQLATNESNAWTNQENELADNILKIQKRFYEEHVSQWVSDFCEKVIDHANHPFYRLFSEVTKGFIEFEQENLQGHGDEPDEGDRLTA